MNISQAVEYGIRGIIHMARDKGDGPLLVMNIAQAEDISPTFLHKIFKRMVQGRILNSRRGVGYTLARPPESITLLEIVEAIEGPIQLRRCVVDEDYCPRSDDCTVSVLWKDVQATIVDKLRSISLQDMANLE